MFCPNCGQERLSTDTSFCSRCGFLLTGTAELLQTGGVIPQLPAKSSQWSSPRAKGVKKGVFIFLLSFLIIPIVTMITVALDAEPFALVISAVLLFVGSLLRIAWALLFESPYISAESVDSRPAFNIPVLSGHKPADPALPPQRSVPATIYAAPVTGSWRDTNDLVPQSVTDGTTQLLEDETPRQ